MDENEKFLLELGKRIEKSAMVRYTTQIKFAEECEVDARTIRRIYKAQQNPTVLVLKQIANALGVKLYELVNLDIELKVEPKNEDQ